jgi:small subunit ribosomal protein S20
LANIKSAKKRAVKAESSRQHNASRRSMLRSYIKAVNYAIEAGDKAKASSALERALPVIDNAAGKGIIHKNKAARTKSRLNASVKGMA